MYVYTPDSKFVAYLETTQRFFGNGTLVGNSVSIGQEIIGDIFNSAFFILKGKLVEAKMGLNFKGKTRSGNIECTSFLEFEEMGIFQKDADDENHPLLHIWGQNIELRLEKGNYLP